MDQVSTTHSLPGAPRELGFFVDGRKIMADGREVFERRSPGHDVPVTRIPKCTGADLDMAVDAARRAFDDRRWSGLNGQERAAVLLKAGALIRERAGEIGDLRNLRMAHPCLERQIARRQVLEAGAEVVTQQHLRRRVRAMIAHLVAFMPQRAEANAAEPTAAGDNLGIEDITDAVADHQVGGTDNTGGNARRAITAGGRLGRDAIDELGLADGAQVLRTVRLEHRAALDEHR